MTKLVVTEVMIDLALSSLMGEHLMHGHVQEAKQPQLRAKIRAMLEVAVEELCEQLVGG